MAYWLSIVWFGDFLLCILLIAPLSDRPEFGKLPTTDQQEFTTCSETTQDNSVNETFPDDADEPYTSERLDDLRGGYQLISDPAVVLHVNFNNYQVSFLGFIREPKAHLNGDQTTRHRGTLIFDPSSIGFGNLEKAEGDVFL